LLDCRSISPISTAISIGRAQAPIGRAQAPIGRAQAPIGRAQAPIGRAQAPIGRAQAPISRAASTDRVFGEDDRVFGEYRSCVRGGARRGETPTADTDGNDKELASLDRASIDLVAAINHARVIAGDDAR
jgi:hypothetical protein